MINDSDRVITCAPNETIEHAIHRDNWSTYVAECRTVEHPVIAEVRRLLHPEAIELGRNVRRWSPAAETRATTITNGHAAAMVAAKHRAKLLAALTAKSAPQVSQAMTDLYTDGYDATADDSSDDADDTPALDDLTSGSSSWATNLLASIATGTLAAFSLSDIADRVSSDCAVSGTSAGVIDSVPDGGSFYFAPEEDACETCMSFAGIHDASEEEAVPPCHNQCGCYIFKHSAPEGDEP